MNPRWAGFTAPFRWLIEAFDVGRHQPQVVIGAIATLVIVGMLPSLPPQLMAAVGSPVGFGGMMGFQGISLILGILVTPVLTAGVYRIIDGAERGQPVQLANLFDGFKDGSYGSLVAVTLLSLLLLFVLGLIMAVTMALVVGTESLPTLQAWLQQFAALQSQAEAGKAIQPDQLPTPPPALGSLVAVMLAFSPLWLFVIVGSAWALISVALRGAPPIAAMLGGLRAAVVNGLPIFLLVLVLLFPVALLGLLFGLIMAAVVGLFGLISPALAGIATIALMFGFTVVLSAVAYGFLLTGWRAACGDAEGAAPSQGESTTGFEA